MKEFNKTVDLVSYTINDVKEKDLNSEIYKKCIDDIEEYLQIQKDLKVNVLDMFARESYVRENIKDWICYKSIDNIPSYRRDDENVVIDIMADVNNIPIKERESDIIFTIGSRFGFGENHQSLFEVERIMKTSGLLIVSLSKYWYYKEFSQFLLGYRPQLWKYVRAIEINYQIVETKIESAKYFAYYKFNG